MHITLKRWFQKMGINITLIGENLNFCDLWDNTMHQFCPIKPGKYHFNYNDSFPILFPSVSANNAVYIYSPHDDA